MSQSKFLNSSYLQKRSWKADALNLETASPTGSLSSGGDSGALSFADKTWTLRNTANLTDLNYQTGSGLTFNMSATNTAADGDAMNAPYMLADIGDFVGDPLGKDDVLVFIAEVDASNADAATEAIGVGFWDEDTRASETYGFGAMLGHNGTSAGLLVYRWRAFGKTSNFFTAASGANVVGICLKRETCDVRYGNTTGGVLPSWSDMTTLGTFSQTNLPADGDDPSVLTPQMLNENISLILTAQTGNTANNFSGSIRQIHMSRRKFSDIA